MGRLYPESIELEAAFLAGILSLPEAFLTVGEDVSPDDFSDEFYGTVWRLMTDMLRDTGTVSAVVLAAKLGGFESENFNPKVELAKLGGLVVTTANIPEWLIPFMPVTRYVDG